MVDITSFLQAGNLGMMTRSTPGSNHQGDLSYDTYVYLGCAGVYDDAKTWHVPAKGSTSHKISVTSNSQWHGQSEADVMDRMGLTQTVDKYGIGTNAPWWGFKASCGGSTKYFLVYRI